MGASDEKNCRLCDEDVETAWHLYSECPVLALERMGRRLSPRCAAPTQLLTFIRDNVALLVSPEETVL